MYEKNISRKQHLISYSIVYLIAIYPLHPAWSSIITPSDQTIKISQKNTIPIINITTPNDIGVSHNQFHAFNVGKPGVVINNAISPVNSQLAGLVNANPNLDGNAANLVINEVVGNGHSQLLGKLEIAGKQANVLIANQNGITCDGCSFINTPEITLTTGKPSFNSQGLLSAIEVKKGNIVIGEQGMDAESQSYADILSRSIELNGKIKAKNLSLMQGNNRIDFEKGTVNNISGEGNKPTLSIDTKALGGMYANQIRLVSTESGVGVNLSDIQTKQNSLNLTVDGKITFNGNINAKSDINVSTKALQINPDVKLKSERDITLATNTLTNNGAIIAEKDMRLFTDKLSNKGGEALIQAKDNLWIQKNAQGDPSTLIENQSATIKTEQGDLIIRTKKLVNESITPFFKEIKQEPDSNHAVSIGNYLFTPAHNGSKDNFLLVTFFAALKDFVGNKWFDILDLRKNGGVNVERTSFEIDKEYIPSVIFSGKNLYLQSNELINEQSKIIVTDNLIATGDNIKSSYYLLGDYNKWDLYFLEEEIDDYFEYYNYDYDESKHNIDKSKLFKEDCFVLHEKAGSYYEFVINDSPEYMLKAGGNLVLDFKNSINLDRKFPFSEKNIKEIKNILTSDNTVLANNILLNSADINISLNLKADNNLSILANKNINIKNSSLLTEEAISLTANDNISFEQGVVITKDLSVLSKSGNVNYSLDPAYSYSLSNFAPSIIDVSDKVTFYSGGSILFDNALVNRVNKINLTALENIKIQRNESLLFGLLPNKASNTSISELLLKFGSWEFGNITLTAGKDIVSQGIKYSSDKAITFNAGQDIFLASKSIKEADPFFSDIHYPKLQSKLFANNNIILNAARDIDLTSTVLSSQDKAIVLSGRDIKLGATAYSAIENPHEDDQDIQYVTTAITGNKGITLASNGAITTQASTIKSEDDITISSGGNIQLGSVRTHFRKESGSDLEDIYKHIGTDISSGKNLTLLSEGSILFQASKLTANNAIDIAAKGGFLYAQAMEESSYYKEKKKKCNWWTLCITKKKYTKTFYNTNNKVTEFIANGDISLFAKDDITLEATKISTAKNAKITSKTGKVNFKAVKNTAFKQVITHSKDIYITQRNQGYNKENWALPELYIGGKLTIDAPAGISADIKTKKKKTLEQVLTVLSNTPEYAWLNDLQQHENVNWNLVKETYASWDEKSQQLNPVVGAIIAIAVGVATYGTSTAATIGGMASKAATAAGASASIASTASVAAQAGFASLASQAAVSLAENRGDLLKTVKSLGSSDTVKSIVTSMAVAGALQGLDQFMGWDQAIQGGTLPSAGKLLATDNATWNQVAQRVAAHSVVSSTLGTAIQGGSFIDNFKTALLSNIGSQFHAEGANLIGNNGAVLGHAGKAISHAILSGLSAQISGGNVKGAIIGGLAAEIAAISLGDNTIKAEEWQKKSESQAQFVRLFGGIAGGVFTGEPGGVYSGATGAENSFRYNYLSHHQQKLMEKELSVETNYFKKTAIYLKWLSTDIGQDAGFNAGLVAGIPTGLYETIEGVASLAANPLETYQAIKAVIQSDNALDTLTHAVKQSYIDRIEKLEAEYQKAGVSGSFNAGVESGKLIFDLAALFAGGVGVAKGGSQLIAKTSAKIIGKTTRFSFPDGISFQIELPKHLATVDKFTQKMGISGGHNANVFYNVVKDKNLKIIKEIPTNVRGIMYIEYKIPAKHPQTGEITHYKANGAQPFKKTIYDPKIFSDQKILELGQKAAANGYKNALDKELQSYDAMSEGITFRVYLDKETKMVTNFHPK